MVTNQDVADKIGLSVFSVSKIRNGVRYPSLRVMQCLQRHYGWSLEEQAQLMLENRPGPGSPYAVKFSEVTGLSLFGGDPE